MSSENKGKKPKRDGETMGKHKDWSLISQDPHKKGQEWAPRACNFSPGETETEELLGLAG